MQLIHNTLRFSLKPSPLSPPSSGLVERTKRDLKRMKEKNESLEQQVSAAACSWHHRLEKIPVH